MQRHLQAVMLKLGELYADELTSESRYFRDVNIGQAAADLGFEDVESAFLATEAVILLKGTGDGMKVRIDGRTFVNYSQFDNGVVVPTHVAKRSGLHYRAYAARDSMVRVFD